MKCWGPQLPIEVQYMYVHQTVLVLEFLEVFIVSDNNNKNSLVEKNDISSVGYSKRTVKHTLKCCTSMEVLRFP